MPDYQDDEFEWDEEKNRKNIEKHGYSFEEAKEAFQDPDGLGRNDTRPGRALR